MSMTSLTDGVGFGIQFEESVGRESGRRRMGWVSR